MNITIFHDGGWFYKPLKKNWESKGHVVRDCVNFSYWRDFEPDLIFFETCTANILYYSKHCKHDKKVFCRIHGVGIRYNHHLHVDWSKVDGVIFVNERLQNKFNADTNAAVPTFVVHNGVDMDQFTLKRNFEPTFKLAYVGRLIPLKNYQILPNIVERFKQIDNRYHLEMATGKIKHEDMNEWLEDKDYLIHPSLSETFCYAVAEAMAKGIRPLINNWPGAIETFGEEFLLEHFNLQQDPQRFRNFIETNYNQSLMIEKITNILQF